MLRASAVLLALAATVALALALAGCTALRTNRVYSCFDIQGPPPGGRTVVITVPDDAPQDVHFLTGCQLKQ